MTRGRIQDLAVVSVLLMMCPSLVESLECFASMGTGKIVHFVCGLSETCCGSQCCPSKGPFYMHWYFWLAISMLLGVLMFFAVSACRHWRQQQQRRHFADHHRPQTSKLSLGKGLLLNYHIMRSDFHSRSSRDVRLCDVRKCDATLPVTVSLLPPPYSSLAMPQSGELAPPPYDTVVVKSEV